MTRKEHKRFANDSSAVDFTVETIIEIWGTNSTLDEKKAKLEVTCFDLDDEKWRDGFEQDIVLKQNSSTEIWKGKLPGQLDRKKDSEISRNIIISAKLLVGDDVISRYSNWYVELSYRSA